MNEASTLSLAPSLSAANDPPIRLGSLVRVVLYVACGLITLPLFSPQLNVPISGLPFGLIDYVFFGTGLLGFLVVPRHVPATVPAWIIIGFSAAFLFAATFAVEREVAFKDAVALAFWGGGAVGLSRFMVDPAVRRAFAICLLVVGARWGVYAAGAFQQLPAFETLAEVGLTTKGRLINHNFVAAPIAAASGFCAGYFLGKRNRRGYVLAAVAVGLGALTISFCLSRQGVLALFSGTAFAVLRTRKVSKGLLGLAVVAALIALILVQAQERGVFGERAAKVDQRYDPFNVDMIQATTSQRTGILDKGLALATDFPGCLVGIGSGNFPYVTEVGDRRFTRGPVLHNEHFTILLEGGVLALICWLALLRRTVLAPIREMNMRPLDTGIVTAGMVYMIQLFFVNARGLMFWWMIAGVAGAVAATRFQREQSDRVEETS